MKKVLVLVALAASACHGTSEKTTADLAGFDQQVSNGQSDLAGADLAGADLASSTDLAIAAGDLAGGGGGPVTIHVYNQNGDRNADFVAWQDGSGAWQALASEPSGDYVLEVTDAQGRYAVAAADVTTFADAPYGWLLYATVADGAEQTIGFVYKEPAKAKTVTYQYANIPASHTAGAAFSRYNLSSSSSTSPQTIMTAAGTFDVLAWVNNSTADTNYSSSLLLQRNVDLTGTPAPFAFDFNDAAAITPAMFNLAIEGTANGSAQVASNLNLRASTTRDYDAQIFFRSTGLALGADGKGSTTVPLLPLDKTTGADVQSVVVSVPCGSGGSCYAQKYVNQGADLTITTPPAMTFASQTFNDKLPAMTWNAVAGAQLYYLEWGAENAAANGFNWDAYITPTWFGGSTPSFTMPLLSGLTGYPTALSPQGGSSGSYRGTAYNYGSTAKVLSWLLGGPYKPAAGELLLKSTTNNKTFKIP